MGLTLSPICGACSNEEECAYHFLHVCPALAACYAKDLDLISDGNILFLPSSILSHIVARVHPLRRIIGESISITDRVCPERENTSVAEATY
jgi:hypothetical protein